MKDMSKTRWKTRLALFGKGLAMGTADVIPGVSGGTIAFITGIYDTLVRSLSEIGFRHVRHFFSFVFNIANAKKRNLHLEVLRSINWGFFLPLGLGIVTAILTMAKGIPYLMEVYPVQMYALFFGLILASIPLPFAEVKRRAPDFAVLVASSILSFFLLGPMESLEGSLNPFYLFFSGAIAITALILPGISGSYILVLLGQYKLVLTAVNERNLYVIGIFMAGIVVGIFSFIRVLEYLLKNHRSWTMAALTGIMVGSLRVIWPLKHQEGASTDPKMLIYASICALIGFAIVFILNKFSPN